MVQTATVQTQYIELFEKPTIPGMLALTPKQFEHFVGYVFERAGYQVADASMKFINGVDIELRTPAGALAAGVEVKKFAIGSPVDKRTVETLLGARLIRRNRIMAYLATTSDFTSDAYVLASEERRLTLLSGSLLVRYVDYLRGSVDGHPDGHMYAIAPDALKRSDELAELRRQPHPKVLVIGNNKGGVGKTTTARYIALNLAERGQRVLLVDMDPQANLSEAMLNTTALKIPSEHLGDYFAGHAPLRKTMVSSPVHSDIKVLVSHPDLARRDSGGFGRPEVEMQFAIDLLTTFSEPEPKSHNALDWIIIDTPPTVSLFTRCALAAGDFVLAPVRARESSFSGTQNLLAARHTMGALTGFMPSLIGGLVTHHGEDASSQLPLQRITQILLNNGSGLFETRIPVSVAIERQPPLAHNAKHAYEELTEEVIERCQQQ